MKQPDVHEVSLENGFRALLVERHTLPVVASTLWYRVGSRDELSGETGLSHFLEHMMFKGTDDYRKGEIDLLTAKLGGSNNAFTSHDVTAYYFTLAADRWETALQIEASRMSGCLLDDSEFAAERSVVLEELAMGEDDPWHGLWETAESTAYVVHPYHHPIIGWRQDLERLTVGRMRAYYRRHYGPNRAFLVAVGDFDTARVEARLGDLFGLLSPSAEPRAAVLDEPEQRGERRAVHRFPGKQDIARLAFCFHSCRMGARDDFVLDVLAHVLAGSKTSRLYRRLVLDEQIATHVAASNDVRLDPGLFALSLELREGAPPARAEAIVREELDKLQQGKVSAVELSRARTQLRSAHLFEEETVLDVALRIGRFEAVAQQGFGVLGEMLEQYASVTAAEVREAARRYLGGDRWNVAWSLPGENGSRRAARASSR